MARAVRLSGTHDTKNALQSAMESAAVIFIGETKKIPSQRSVQAAWHCLLRQVKVVAGRRLQYVVDFGWLFEAGGGMYCMEVHGVDSGYARERGLITGTQRPKQSQGRGGS